METCRFCNEPFDPNSIASGGLFGQCSKCLKTKQRMQVMMSYPVTTYRNEEVPCPLSVAKVKDDYFTLNLKADQEYLLAKIKSALGLGVSIGVRGEIGIDTESADLGAFRMNSVSFIPPAEFPDFDRCEFDFKSIEHRYSAVHFRKDWYGMLSLKSLLVEDAKEYPALNGEQSDCSSESCRGSEEGSDRCVSALSREADRRSSGRDEAESSGGASCLPSRGLPDDPGGAGDDGGGLDNEDLW